MREDILEQCERLARAFDREFSLPLATERRELRDLIVTRLGTHWYALPVDELAGVHQKTTIRFLPDAPPHCRGLAGLRGRIAVVYDLGAVLGSPCPELSSWVVQTKADPEVALLVPRADRYLRVPRDSIAPGELDAAVAGAFADAGHAINVLSVERIVRAIQRGGGAP